MSNIERGKFPKPVWLRSGTGDEILNTPVTVQIVPEDRSPTSERNMKTILPPGDTNER